MLTWTEFQTKDGSTMYHAAVNDDVFYSISKEDWLWTINLSADDIIFIGKASSLEQVKTMVDNDYEKRITI